MDNLWQQPPTSADLPAEQTIEVQMDGDGIAPQMTGSGISLPFPDGSIEVDLNPQPEAKDTEFDDNLAMHMDDMELARIAEDLLTGISGDDESRADWVSTRELAIDLLGLRIEQPGGDVTTSTAPIEGMATVRHPVLLEAVLRSQATACAELLPASGPAKVEIMGDASPDLMKLSEALETDINDYLTTRAREYYPDTRRTLFWSSFGGCGFKKIYFCPIRQRPVSESVDAKDIIVSAAATDLGNAQRVTHVISMRQSVLKRMQVIGAYRDVAMSPPTGQPSELDEKQARVEGIAVRAQRPEDQPYKIYECYCELDLDEFAPPQFKDKAIPLPFRVTMEKDSRVILEIRRNWDEDDEICLAKRIFVKYPYIEAMGIYGIGLLHILGNANMALTAAWRLYLDNCQFANFPSGIVDKGATRQNTNELRAPAGSLIPLDFGNRRASDVFAPLPYKPLDAVCVQFIQQIESTVQRLGGAAEIQVGEGKQDAPVGTTLALIEQATKIESEVHKGLHAAQAEELRLLADLFRDDPSALWRGCKKSAMSELMGISGNDDAAEQQRRETFVRALSICELVPASDPNIPSHVHRDLKMQVLMQIAAGNPNINKDEVDKIAVRQLGFDPQLLWNPPAPPQQAQPDPLAITAQAQQTTAQAKMADSQTKAKAAQINAQIQALKLQTQKEIAGLELQREAVIHAHDTQLAQQQTQADLVTSHMDRQADLEKHRLTLAADIVNKAHDRAAQGSQNNGGIVPQ
jgi:hypothetical protein